MKKLLTGVCAASMAVAVAGTAAADSPTKTEKQNAAKYCKALRTSSGSKEAFAEAVRAMTGAKKVTSKNAYGKCVSAQARQEAKDDQEAKSEAIKQCKTEQAQSDDEFSGAHGGKTFSQFYGTNKNGKNAYGKCVSQQRKAQEQQADQENKNELNAAKQCKAESKQSDDEFSGAHGGKTFTQFYGTNKNGKNAFGKCVSSKSKAMSDDGSSDDGSGDDGSGAPATA
jgi:hypothetical protein